MQGWRFEPISALIGAALGLLATWLAYILREPLSRAARSVSAALQGFGSRFSADTEQRYRDLVAEWAKNEHALAPQASLDQVFVHPPLAPLPPFPDPEAESAPPLHDVNLGSVLNGHPLIILVGEVGSGRTMTLAFITYLCSRSEAVEKLNVSMERLPIYVYLPDMDWETPAQGPEPAAQVDRLVEGALALVGGKSSLERSIRDHLSSGTAIILVDGWYELDAGQRHGATTWLSGLAQELPENVWVATAKGRGFAPLAEAGFVPVRLGRWTTTLLEALAECEWYTVAGAIF